MDNEIYLWKSNKDYKSVYHFWNVFVLSVTKGEYNFMETLKEEEKFIVRGADIYKSTEDNKVIKDIEILELNDKGENEIVLKYQFRN